MCIIKFSHRITNSRNLTIFKNTKLGARFFVTQKETYNRLENWRNGKKGSCFCESFNQNEFRNSWSDLNQIKPRLL